MGFDFFSIMTIIFPIFFMAVLCFILYRVFQGLREWSYNNNSPQITTEAKVVAKRLDISSHLNSHNVGEGISTSHTTQHTTYYVTFQLGNGQYQEFHIKSGTEYGLLVEQDLGTLSYQGTRYLDFKRQS